MSEPIRDDWGSTAAEREADRPYVRPEFLDSFDREFYDSFGHWPSGSPHEGTRPHRDDPRRAKIQALADQSPFPGERDAALRMLANMDRAHERDETERLMMDAQHEADYEDAAAHGEA